MALQEEQGVFSLIFLAVVILLMLYTLAGNFFQHKHFHAIHETGFGILIGFVIGGLIFWQYPDVLQGGFSEKIFFYGLLPQIIFEGGYNLKKSRLFQNFSYISIYGLIGTLVSFFVILGLTVLVNQWGWIRKFDDAGVIVVLSMKNILLYSATICATDSVAALTMIKADKYPKLFSIVFGEGMVNDAVAIILFRSVAELYAGEGAGGDLEIHEIVTIIENFLLNLVCSLLIGVFTGLLCTWVFKKLRALTEDHENYVLEIVLSYFFGILSYGWSQLLEFSGVISVLVCGITMAHFNFYNLSRNGQLLTGVSFKSLSFAAESFLFVYLGLSSWNYLGGNYEWSWTFIIMELIICAIARFASIFLLSGIFYLVMKKVWDVNIFELAIVWFAGVIRGSVAFALILTIGGKHDTEEEQRETQIIKGTVLIMVFLTTIALGGIMPSFVSCSLSRAEKMQQNRIEKKKSTMSSGAEQPLIEEQQIVIPKQKEKGCLKRFWGNLDEKYFKPFFIYKYNERKDEIKQSKKKMKLNSDNFRGASEIVPYEKENIEDD